jgi:hypothetical protein
MYRKTASNLQLVRVGGLDDDVAEDFGHSIFVNQSSEKKLLKWASIS